MIICAVFLPMLFGVIGYVIGLRNKRLRDIFCVLAALSTCAFAYFAKGTASIGGIFGVGLTFSVSGLQRVLAILASLIWLASEIFTLDYMSNEHGRNRYHLFSLLSLGATEGVFLSGDLFTTFVFFEVMSFTSYVLVKQEQTPKAIRAGQTYLAVAVFGGMAMLAGLGILYSMTKTLSFDSLFSAAQTCDRAKLYVSAALILTGFGAKAGMFPVHIWLPDTHPAAPAPASALLSCILIKTGAFGIIILTTKLMAGDRNWGMAVTVLGTITMALGAVLAVLSTDLKRTLACSSLSQIGFILIGVGTAGILGNEGALSMDGAINHIVNHAAIKCVLFTCAGVVFMNAEKLDLNAVRGFGRGKPVLIVTFLIAALGVSGVPLFNGYISKTLLHEGIIECGLPVIEWIFIISGGLTLAYMTKLFVCLFVEKGYSGEERKPYMSKLTGGILIVTSLCMLAFGMLPSKTLADIASVSRPFMGGASGVIDIKYFGMENLIGALKSIVIGVVVYFVVIRKLLMRGGEYIDVKPDWLSLENSIYRPIFIRFLPWLGLKVAELFDCLTDFFVSVLSVMLFKSESSHATPKEDRYFGRYSDEPFLRKGFTDTLAFSFQLFGIAVVLSLIFILLHKI